MSSTATVRSPHSGTKRATWVRRVLTCELTRDTPPEHRLTWTLDQAARTDLEEEIFGKRVLITDRDDWPIVDVVAAYRSQSEAEHTFRFLKQTIGWTTPRIRAPEAADRWTWLVIAVYTQLRLARPLVEDLRRPWERKAVTPARLSPARVRRGFRAVRPATALPASAPKFSRPGPGRPAGSRNSHRARRHDPGKTTKTDIKG